MLTLIVQTVIIKLIKSKFCEYAVSLIKSGSHTYHVLCSCRVASQPRRTLNANSVAEYLVEYLVDLYLPTNKPVTVIGVLCTLLSQLSEQLSCFQLLCQDCGYIAMGTTALLLSAVLLLELLVGEADLLPL